ncbi:hypothetical protein [Sutcliffiella rhizosphaerae]|uniref:Uncharacterized protein n=1 Tax=Sutcliffiella rhizosphaerae TaxID=2880967 RepID=A0ABN8AAY3_9BACI|nr:hypothetical protein [Sutcliffiella rhizosphaerae]CAG9619840.1 hypothetical protein BACCIP111883_00608 [Sutcliffiella rhizosphaerae]
MVTAIVIPILIIYFFWITKKEKQKQLEKWRRLTEVPLEARLEGEILTVHTDKKRFYHELYSLETILHIKSKKGKYTAIYKQPCQDNSIPPSLIVGQSVELLGQWNENNGFTIGKFIIKTRH